MIDRVKVTELDLNQPLADLSGLEGYNSVQALVRWHGDPIGYVSLPLNNGCCSASAIRAAILDSYQHTLLQSMVKRDLEAPFADSQAEENTDAAEAVPANDTLVTVAVCTRDRAEQLKDCLMSLSRLVYNNVEILVVDNAPSTDQTRNLVQSEFPRFRYVTEPRPGLDWARNRAIEEARGEILAYTDDDVVVDPLWVSALVRLFADDPAVMAVTGLVAPYEMETRAQVLFERYGGFGRGFKRIWFRFDDASGDDPFIHIGAGRFGTGANMAYRRSVFGQIGGFDPALDVGTVTNGGGDLEMFFRVLEEGHTLVYEPAALVWHRHRTTYEELHVQLTNHGVGLYSYFVRSARNYTRRRNDIIRFGLWWFWYWNIRRLLKSFIIRQRVPRDLILAELRGALIGVSRYPKARIKAEEIRARYAIEPSRDSGGVVPGTDGSE